MQRPSQEIANQHVDAFIKKAKNKSSSIHDLQTCLERLISYDVDNNISYLNEETKSALKPHKLDATFIHALERLNEVAPTNVGIVMKSLNMTSDKIALAKSASEDEKDILTDIEELESALKNKPSPLPEYRLSASADKKSQGRPRANAITSNERPKSDWGNTSTKSAHAQHSLIQPRTDHKKEQNQIGKHRHNSKPK